MPLSVTYALALPPEAAVSGFTFLVGEETIVGEIDLRSRARARFEEALVEGRSAALLEEDRSTLFRQEVGNIPPQTEVRIEIAVDQRLAWICDGLDDEHDDGLGRGWEWRFPTVVAPRYVGEGGRVADGERITQEVAEQPSSPRLGLSLSIRDALLGGGPTSTSHSLAVVRGADTTEVSLHPESGAFLDRDIVVRWPVAAREVGVSVDAARPPQGHSRCEEVHALLTLVPPASLEATGRMNRDLIVLLDTSGSMEGRPLQQAKAVVRSLIEGLKESDQLEMIEFSSAARHWQAQPKRATESAKRAALRWLDALSAGGGTEMCSGIVAAMASLREEAQRQVVVISDGLIGFEEEVVATILERLPRGSRLHTVGVGSAPNRSLTGPAARAGRGVEVIVGLDESPAPAARRLVAALERPVVVDLVVEGEALLEQAPDRLPDLFAGRPALVALRLAAAGGRLRVRGRTAVGEWSQSVSVPALEPGCGAPAVSALFAREAVDTLEMLIVTERRKKQDLEASIERLGLDFQIATRLTTWIAVSEKRTVDPREPSRREVMPQQVPHGMSVEGLGLRRVVAPRMASAVMADLLTTPDDSSILLEVMPFESPQARAAARNEPFAKLGTTIGRSAAAMLGKLLHAAGRLRTPEPSTPFDEWHGRTLAGRVVVEDEHRLVLEIEVDAELDWQPGKEVRVHLEDGGTVLAKVIAGATTRSGRIAAGQRVRLAIEPVEGRIVGVALGDSLEIRVEHG